MGLGATDLVVFDKDGTLLDFHAMWGGWARALGARLEASARRPVAPDVFAAIGFDPSSARIAPGGPLAIGTMAEIEGLLATVLRRWCPSVAAARRAVEAAWFVPDPATAAVPLVDLGDLFEFAFIGKGNIQPHHDCITLLYHSTVSVSVSVEIVPASNPVNSFRRVTSPQ